MTKSTSCNIRTPELLNIGQLFLSKRALHTFLFRIRHRQRGIRKRGIRKPNVSIQAIRLTISRRELRLRPVGTPILQSLYRAGRGDDGLRPCGEERLKPSTWCATFLFTMTSSWQQHILTSPILPQTQRVLTSLISRIINLSPRSNASLATSKPSMQ